MKSWRAELVRLAFLCMTRNVGTKRHFVILNVRDERREEINPTTRRYFG